MSLSILLGLLLSARAFAATLEVHGTLEGPSGATAAGAYLLRFRLFEAKPGSPAAWTDAIYVPVSAGAFRVTLGQGKPIPEGVLKEGYRVAVEAPSRLGWRATIALQGHSGPGGAAAVVPTAQEQAPLADIRRIKASLSEEAPSVPAAPAVAAPAAAKKASTRAPSRPAPPSEDTERLKRRLEALERKLAPQAPRAVTHIYEVVAGDTLQTIAQKLWGDPSRWTELYRANADRVQRGGYVEPGQRLVVPQGMP